MGPAGRIAAANAAVGVLAAGAGAVAFRALQTAPPIRVDRSLAGVFALVWVARMPVLAAQASTPRGVDNRHPRRQQAGLVGWGARANAAHLNTLEALAMYAPAALLALRKAREDPRAARMAALFLAARVLYLPCYWFDLHAARTFVWLCGLSANVLMYAHALEDA